MANQKFRMTAIGQTNGDGDWDWENALIDSFIMALMTGFSTLAGIGGASLRTDPTSTLIAVLIAAGVSFTATLAIKRGLVES